MARLPRYFVEGVPMHVIVRGNDRQDTFRTEGDRLFFHRCLSDLSRETGVDVHAYVMMTNHVHLLATGRDSAAVPDLVQRLGRRYVGYFNYLHERTGTLWEGRYKATLVEAERYFLTCQRYIELNPVRAGIVGSPANFPWSSHRRLAWGRSDDVVTPHALYEDLGHDEGSRQLAYRALFEVDLDAETLERIRSTAQKGWVLGDPDFQARVEGRGNRRAAPRPRGRPRKIPELT
jgi:putative transposase